MPVITGKQSKCGCFIFGGVLPDVTLNAPFPQAGTPPKPDLQSIVNSIVQLQNVVNNILNNLGNPGNNGNGGGGGGGGGGNNNQNNDGQKGKDNGNNNNDGQKNTPTPTNKQQDQGFQEVGRKVDQVKIFNPNDDNQFVVVNQISQLKMLDKSTGTTWDWNLAH